jgi:hypothetical protein
VWRTGGGGCVEEWQSSGVRGRWEWQSGGIRNFGLDREEKTGRICREGRS